MPCNLNFEGWSSIEIPDLIVAYRKAKADCFYDNNFPTKIKFAEYEQNLLLNLQHLLDQLKENKGFNNLEYLLGEYRILPKKISIEKGKKNEKKGHIYFSDSAQAFENLASNSTICPEFRVVGDFPVDMHIISALWINLVGCKFDACLSGDVYGSRLRRVRDAEKSSEDPSYRPFHISVIGSFQKYFQPYKNWRDRGLKKIRAQVGMDKEKSIMAVSLDLKSYYHQLCPSFISKREFHEELGIHLDSEEKEFTQQISNLLYQWSEGAKKFIKEKLLIGSPNNKANGGLVIGLSASRVISNIALIKWDKLIIEKLSPVHYYGRYVDDMFLVIPDPLEIKDSTSFMEFLSQKFGQNEDGRQFLSQGEGGRWNINLGEIYGSSEIELQEDKQKLFILKGQAGLDLVDSIEKGISELSSEYRLMPDSRQLECAMSTQVLVATENAKEEADTLRRADGLSMRRLGLALQLRKVEVFAHDLPKDEWERPRKEFYDLVYNHVLKSDTFFTYYKYLPRLLGLAIHLKDFESAEEIIKKSYHIILSLSKENWLTAEINGIKHVVNSDNRQNIWESFLESLNILFVEIIATSYPLCSSNELQEISTLKWCGDLLSKRVMAENLSKKVENLFCADLARTPYKALFSTIENKENLVDRVITFSSAEKDRDVINAFKESCVISYNNLEEFVKSSRKLRLKKWVEYEPIIPFLFPTRALTPSEIAEYALECIGLKNNSLLPEQIWAKYTQAVRGVWVLQDSENKPQLSERFIRIGNKPLEDVIIAITNFDISIESWERSAQGTPDLSWERYAKMSELVNQAIKLNPKPDYLLLPEVSLPLRWVTSVSNRLQSSSINLIAGTEYRHSGKNTINSEACLVLRDNRLGYPSPITIWQPKLKPSIKEGLELKTKYNKSWNTFSETEKAKEKIIYIHNEFHFGVMVCSEFLNTKDRISFQGNVDGLMILAWNKDLGTFSTHIKSSALDIHANMILVNNRKYGDSRVRSPKRKSFKRDVARLRGGENDFCVAARLDIKSLREFQTEGEVAYSGNNLFKNIPDGFEISTSRKRFIYSEFNFDEGDFFYKKSSKFFDLDIPDSVVKEKFEEAILNHFRTEKVNDLKNAIDKAFANIGSRIRFGYKKSCVVVWYSEVGYVHNYRKADTFGWGKRSIKKFGNYIPKEISSSEWEAREKAAQNIREKIALEFGQKQEEAAQKSQRLFKIYNDDKKNCGYLREKGIQHLNIKNVKYHKGALIIPIMDINDKIWSLQIIKENLFGEGYSKHFIKNGKKRGNFFVLQDTNISTTLKDQKKIYLAEGFATAATIHEATNQSVLLCFDAQNIKSVLDNLIKIFPEKEYIVMADNDLWGDTNTGKKVSDEILHKYSDQYNIKVKLPHFELKYRDKSPTDFNDLHKLFSIDEVRKQIE